MKRVTLDEIAGLTGGRVVGDGSRTVSGVCAPREASEDMLCVVWEKRALEIIPDCVPILAGIGALSGRDGVEHKNPRAALVSVLPLFERRKKEMPGIHPSAQISDGAVIGESVSIGPCCVVSDGASIGDGTVLQGSVFVGCGADIGSDCRIESGVSIQDYVEIGDRVTIHSGCAVGCDGFGFVPDGSGGWAKIPQIGRVVIEDDVEIGANVSIDRATFGVTRVRRGAKIGAVTHIAHNCDIGEDSMIVGFVGLGGSIKIGKNAVVAGMVGIADHVTIGDNVTIAGRSGVTKNIGDGLTVSGFPAREHMEENRHQAALRRVPSYSERLKRVERALDELGELLCSKGTDEE